MKPLFVGLALVLFAFAIDVAKAKSEKISLPVPLGMTRADIYINPAMDHAAGTLILCPGHNGSAQDMVDSVEWSGFAREQNLNLLGLSFASDDNPGSHGYFEAESGSGAILLEGLRRAFGPRPGPLLIYGFSRGAQFTYSLVHWKPGWSRHGAPTPRPSGGHLMCNPASLAGSSRAAMRMNRTTVPPLSSSCAAVP